MSIFLAVVTLISFSDPSSESLTSTGGNAVETSAACHVIDPIQRMKNSLVKGKSCLKKPGFLKSEMGKKFLKMKSVVFSNPDLAKSSQVNKSQANVNGKTTDIGCMMGDKSSNAVLVTTDEENALMNLENGKITYEKLVYEDLSLDEVDPDDEVNAVGDNAVLGNDLIDGAKGVAGENVNVEIYEVSDVIVGRVPGEDIVIVNADCVVEPSTEELVIDPADIIMTDSNVFHSVPSTSTGGFTEVVESDTESIPDNVSELNYDEAAEISSGDDFLPTDHLEVELDVKGKGIGKNSKKKSSGDSIVPVAARNVAGRRRKPANKVIAVYLTEPYIEDLEKRMAPWLKGVKRIKCRNIDPKNLKLAPGFKGLPPITQRKYSKTWGDFVTMYGICLGNPPSYAHFYDFIERKFKEGKAAATINAYYSHLNMACRQVYARKVSEWKEVFT